MSKWISGFCSIGHCEGTKPRSVSGIPMKVCEAWQDCSHSCHLVMTRMFEDADMPRIPVPNPEYVPPVNPYVMPERVIVESPPILSSSDVIIPLGAMETPLPGTVAPATRRSFTETVSGRTARGQLELWIKGKCDEWLVEQYEFSCTPVWISEEIGRTEGIKNPSTGAITACLDRWVKIGFAVIERKPVRFTAYTEDGLKYGLDGLKDKSKRKIHR